MTLTVLEIRDTDLDAIRTGVQQQVERVPEFFAGMPVLLSLSATDGVDLTALQELLTQADLVAVAVLDADARTAEAARAAGLGVMRSPGRRNEEAGRTQADKAATAGRKEQQSARGATAAGSGGTPTRLVTRPVRSGQQIYARGGDLIVTSSVSEGAEVVADGHIHIYGALRGRALAGALGNTQGRIFCRRFEPDLIAIAGCYKVADAIDDGLHGACVQVRLHEDNLLIDLQE